MDTMAAVTKVMTKIGNVMETEEKVAIAKLPQLLGFPTLA